MPDSRKEVVVASSATASEDTRKDDLSSRDVWVEEVPDDSDYGWALFLGFLFAVLSITFVVCVLTLVNSWWMLAVAIGTHVTITTLMVRMILHSMRDIAVRRRLRADDPEALAAAHA